MCISREARGPLRDAHAPSCGQPSYIQLGFRPPIKPETVAHLWDKLSGKGLIIIL